jgi:hypothetical protein
VGGGLLVRLPHTLFLPIVRQDLLQLVQQAPEAPPAS